VYRKGSSGTLVMKDEIPAKYRRNVRRMAFMHTDMNENDALIRAEFEISREYKID